MISAEERKTTFIVVLITSFITAFSLSSLNVAIPVIGMAFHSTATALNWVIVSFTLSSLALSVPFGKAAQISGKHKFFKTGVLIFMCTNFIATFTPSLEALILLRIAQGVGASMIFATNVPILIEAYGSESRGKVLGFQTACIYAGMSVGPVVGGFLTHYWGWRSVFLFIGMITAVSMVLCLFRLPKQDVSQSGKTSDVNPGSVVFYAITILIVLYGLITVTQNLASYFILGGGILCGFLFVKNELRVANPVLDFKMFRGNKNYILSNLCALFNYGAAGAVTYLLSIYLQMVRGYSSDFTGMILICQPIMQVFLSIIAGNLSDRYSPYRLSTIGMCFCAAALYIYSLMDIDAPILYVVSSLAIAGIGFGIFASPNTNAVMSSVPRSFYSMASSILSTMRSSGHVVGMAIVTIIMNLMFSTTPVSELTPTMLMSCMRISFCVLAVFCTIGIFFSLNRKQES